MEKVFIAAPTNQVKSYCQDRYFSNILSLFYPNKEYYYVDNSPTIDYSLQLMFDWGVTVDWCNPKGQNNVVYMNKSWTMIRDKFLASDCTHWLSVEVDLFPPKYIIEQLISHNLPIVTAPYFIGQKEKSQLCAVQIEDSWQGIKNFTDTANINLEVGYSLFKGGLQRVEHCGIGCALISRSVMEQVEFYIDFKQQVHSDTFFYHSLKDLGIPVYQDQSLLIAHENINWEKNVLEYIA